MSSASGASAMAGSVNAGANGPDWSGAWQPYYWSVRRELWEHRSVYLAPLGMAAVVLFGFMFGVFLLPRHVRNAMTLGVAHQRAAFAQPFDLAAVLIMGAAFLVSIFYSVDALYGERRDRSILFWKSLPVSDLTTVLAKASIPLLVLPAIAFAATVLTEAIMLMTSSVVLLASGLGLGMFWSRLDLIQEMFQLIYHLVTVHALWYAPLYAWLLLVSAWARRAPLLWAVLPPFAAAMFERMAFHTSYFAQFLGDRVGGGDSSADAMQGSDFLLAPGMHMAPISFLFTPGLWVGLMFAAAFLFAAARLRRMRQPN